MNGLCSYILPETANCRGKRPKRILFPPEELSKEDSTSILVLLYENGPHVYRKQFSRHHIKYLHYSLAEIQNALEGRHTPAHARTVLRWKRRFSILILMLAFRLRSEVGNDLPTCVNCLLKYLERYEDDWLLVLLQLAFTSKFMECVKFVSGLLNVTPQYKYLKISDLEWPQDYEIYGILDGG